MRFSRPHAIVPDIPWAVAFVLGAAVAPTDAARWDFIRRLYGDATMSLADIGASAPYFTIISIER
jgi:hypothetical protein